MGMNPATPLNPLIGASGLRVLTADATRCLLNFFTGGNANGPPKRPTGVAGVNPGLAVRIAPPH